MDDIRVLITAHEIRAMENEANLTSKKISKLPGRTITPANGIPTKLPSRPVVNPLATSMTADNRSTNILARPIQPLEEASVVLSQQRLKRARNGFERDTTTLASVLNMSDQGTAMSKSAHKFQVEILSDDEASLISDVSENSSLVTERSHLDRNHSHPIQGKATCPKVTVPLAVTEAYLTTGGRPRPVRSETSGPGVKQGAHGLTKRTLQCPTRTIRSSHDRIRRITCKVSARSHLIDSRVFIAPILWI